MQPDNLGAAAWSSAFLNWVFEQAGIVGTGSGANASWLNWGVKLDKPKPGAIVLAGLPNGAVIVGFYLKDLDDKSILALSGNVRDQVTTATIPKSIVRAYRWPRP